MLTLRQYQIAVKAASTTLQNKELADHFHIATRVIKWHMGRIYQRLEIEHCRTALAIYYAKNGRHFKTWTKYVRWVNAGTEQAD